MKTHFILFILLLASCLIAFGTPESNDVVSSKIISVPAISQSSNQQVKKELCLKFSIKYPSGIPIEGIE